MAKYKKVPVGSVPIGAVLKSAIGDPNNPQVQLLTEGTEVTAEFLEKLRMRGIPEVVISQRDLAIFHAFESQGRGKKIPPSHTYVQSLRFNDHTKEIDQKVHDGLGLERGTITEPMMLRIDRPTDCPYDKELQKRWASENDEQIESLAVFFDDSCEGKAPTAGPLRQQCEDILGKMEEDQDALVCLAGTPFASEYPSRHAVHLAHMAMAIGLEMGLDHGGLIDLGMGCLIHDVGMKHVGPEVQESPKPISRNGLRVLADHPIFAIEVAGKLGEEISHASRMVAYQIHERLDGSGYPRGRKSAQIHEFAKIAAVADTFVALVAPRPHRLGIQGYYAMKYVLEAVKLGKLDPRPVRGLLRATSLHPIGSYVELSNDRIGRVIRTGGGDYEKPTIEMWPPDALDQEPTIVNLQKEESISITRSMVPPQAA